MYPGAISVRFSGTSSTSSSSSGVSMPLFLQLFWAATSPVLKVVILCSVGAVCARKVGARITGSGGQLDLAEFKLVSNAPCHVGPLRHAGMYECIANVPNN